MPGGEVSQESSAKSFNPLGFIDYILEDWLALPSPREILPSPGDIARDVLGKDRTLDSVGRRVRADLDQAASGLKR